MLIRTTKAAGLPATFSVAWTPTVQAGEFSKQEQSASPRLAPVHGVGADCRGPAGHHPLGYRLDGPLAARVRPLGDVTCLMASHTVVRLTYSRTGAPRTGTRFVNVGARRLK